MSTNRDALLGLTCDLFCALNCHSPSRTDLHLRAYTHTLKYTGTHTHTHSNTQVHTHAYTHAHTHRYTHTTLHAHTNTHTTTHTHQHTHTNTRTRTHGELRKTRRYLVKPQLWCWCGTVCRTDWRPEKTPAPWKLNNPLACFSQRGLLPWLFEVEA